MSAEEISLVPSQNGLGNVFQDDALRFGCGPSHPHQQQQRRVGTDPSKARELASYNIDEKHFSSTSSPFTGHQAPLDFPRNIFHRGSDHSRDPRGTSGDESEPDPDEDDEDDDDEDDDDEDDDVDDDDNGVRRHYHHQVVAAAAVDSNDNNNNNSNSININKNNISDKNNNIASGNFDKLGNGNGKPKQQSSFGRSDLEDGAGGGMGQAVTLAEPDGEMYYSQYLQATEGSGGGGKDMGVDSGCGFSGRKEVSSSLSESGESLRAILSDPVTGALMNDAMILPCGHSFGGAGIQHVIRMKACFTCSQSISEDSIAPNLSLQAAVQAFCREEELQFYRTSKRRRERFDQCIFADKMNRFTVLERRKWDKGSYGGSTVMDPPRGRGVQFPFSVTDRVIIKGNKRTPQRFVGREAVVTTQCLNGWYVVKTLDNAESVKLQYRSLAKVSDDASSKTMSSKMVPNWL